VTNSVIHGRGLGRARRMRGLTVEECAQRAGVRPERWRDWEAGSDWPSEVEVRRVLRVGRETLMRLGAATGEG
jgi:transcriptional regulator with XRE-family HTH domain